MSESKNWYKEILNSMEDIVLVKGKDSKILWGNRAFRDAYGLTEEELKGLIDSGDSDPDDTLQYVKDDAFVYKNGKSLEVDEPITYKDGRVGYINTIKSPLFNEKGQVQNTVGVSRALVDSQKIDATDKARARRKEFIHFQKGFVEKLHIPVLFLNARASVVTASRSFKELFQIENQDITGESLFKILKNLKPQEVNHNDFIEKDSFQIHYNDISLIGELTVIPWYINEKEVGGHLVFFKNKTEEHKLEKQLKIERSRSIMNDKIHALGELSAGVGHEINNPLTIILGKLEKIELLHKEDLEKVQIQTDLETIKKNAERISSIVKGLKALSRDTRNDNYSTHQISEIIRDAFSLCSGRIKNLEIDLSADFKKDFVKRCRPSEITQVILNLITNSLDAVKKEEKPWIKLTIDEDEMYQHITITDSGKGIKESIRDTIFEPFFTTKKVGEGTGLGLGISADIIKSHGGLLYYDETEPYTTFKVRFAK